jgi:hypothetical protein
MDHTATTTTLAVVEAQLGKPVCPDGSTWRSGAFMSQPQRFSRFQWNSSTGIIL